ncbi:MAG: asparagine synthase (glutamine-hydrolyzing) [Bacteroidia bacterium]|nr:asparagine synthase (glutamine-hydrolyzing) [Bacteroidia bacterium]
MCGIAGILKFNDSGIIKEKISKLSDALVHRGPDGSGIWIHENGYLGLAHRRLSIIDLSEQASQPMFYKNKQYVITYNGEIYNYIELRNELKARGYSFNTASDTEVILALYDWKKEKCLEDLNGMFAFAIWDENQQQLFCARDRFGEKPFYYYFDNNQFVFASEMKALWAYGIKKEIKSDSLFQFVVNGNLTYNEGVALYKNIKQLSPSEYILLKANGTFTKKKYYEINTTVIDIPFKKAAEQFGFLLEDAVRIRLRSDVAVGSCLSGGLDSSSIVALISKLKSSQQYTFSAIFPGFENDESHYINLMLKKYPQINGFSTVTNVEDLLNEFEKVVYHQEEPFFSASIYAQWSVMKLAKEKGVTVLLDGQGADEILGGYKSCVNQFLNEMIFRNYFKYKREIALFNSRQNKAWKIIPYEKNENLRMKLGRWMITLSRNTKKIPYNFSQYLKKITTSDNDLITLLRYADRNSMAHSREVRLPFLDHRLVNFVFSLPSEYKFKNGWTKYLLRTSMHELLPEEITWRKIKVGFEPPQNNWLNTPAVKDIISKQKKLFNIPAIEDESYTNSTSWRLFLSYFYER